MNDFHFTTRRRLPRDIWALGFGSMFTDISSELIHSLLPVFMATTLGASMVTIGMIEGIAEATASMTKVVSGALSDFVRRRKPLVILGYGLSALTKPIFPLASTIGWVMAARFADRVGKGIRGAPRDALVAEITAKEMRGAAYGLRQALDSVGAFVGPLLALICMALFADNMRTVMWVGVLPAFIAVALLVAYVREPERSAGHRPLHAPLSRAGLKQLPRRYWLIILVGIVFTLARFSEAFLLLRGTDTGLTVGLVPLVMIVMNLVYAGAAFPAGKAADRMGARGLLLAGLGVLIGADLLLATATAPAAVFAGAACWGLHLALTQGLLNKLVADTAPNELRGTAFGVFNLVSGGALLLASLLAGVIWKSAGAPATFFTGASFAAVAALGLLLSRRR